MNKIKDFIYDKNDLLVALLVLVLAAIIILWRVDIIMAYPKQVFAAENGGTSQGSGSDPAGPGGASGDNADTTNPDDDANGGENGDNETGDNENGDNAGNENNTGNDNSDDTQSGSSIWNGDVLARDVEVTVTGYTATAAIGCLVDAGLFEDYSEYQQICEANGMNHEQVSAGVITFPAGSTKKDIARQINWS